MNFSHNKSTRKILPISYVFSTCPRLIPTLKLFQQLANNFSPFLLKPIFAQNPNIIETSFFFFQQLNHNKHGKFNPKKIT